MILPLVTATLPGVLDVPPDQFQTWLKEHDQPPMRARQIRHWILVKGAESFEHMTDLPKALRDRLAAAFVPLTTRIETHQESADNTHKLLVRLQDGRLIECVLIQDEGRRTACVSTQVGCGMGCAFCASGISGLERNLKAGEIVEQLVRLRNLPDPQGQPARLTHVVVMGMGEPLANIFNLLAALEVATAKDGLGIGARHVTISTVGLPSRIRQLANLGKQYHLAVSLHAPNDALRSQIVKTHARNGLAAILDAADAFYEKTGRQVTFEYVLLRDINDTLSHGRELARLLGGRQAHVNVIPFNDVEGLPYRRPTPEGLAAFLTPLRQSGISVKVRKRKGSEIDAACGQLRRRALE